jgi:hypothetical protein
LKSPLVVVSDLHINSTVGLWPSGIKGIDGTEYPQNKFQQWLWKNWIDFWSKIPKGSVVVINGDMTQGIHPNKDGQAMVQSNMLQSVAAIKVLKPLRDKAAELYVIRGTGWHVGIAGEDEEDIARQVNAVPNEDTEEFSRWEMFLNRNDTITHFTHHTRYTSVYPMTGLTKESRGAVDNHVKHGYPIPDLLVRSHIHVFHRYTDDVPNVVTTPSWQLKTEYIFKTNAQAYPTIGGLVLWQDKGQTRIEPILYPLPAPKILLSKS